jgi:proteic killer suppression protein
MIQSFKCGDTHALFITRKNKLWSSLRAVASRKLDQLEAAEHLDDLRSPPGNRLEPLKADRKGQHSIRINDQISGFDAQIAAIALAAEAPIATRNVSDFEHCGVEVINPWLG